ncbi:MAG: ABC-2 family transporter protein [Oscillospiraceae bacterium]|jgi:ABC-2 type transport system permease protein|nr:ABC-2 family transporter protein [Oscillospiraceae bacterium]
MKIIKKYITVYTLAIQGAMEYKTDFLISLVSGGFTIIIQFFLWTAIYGGSAEAELFGYDYGQMVIYVVMAGIMGKYVSTWFEYEIMEDIMEGNLNRFFVQPIGHLGFRAFGFFGVKTLENSMVIIISAILLWVISSTAGVTFSLINLLILLLIAPFSLMISFMLSYCLSVANFWLTWGWGVFNGARVITTILSGGIFPLAVFGDRIASALMFLPFPYIVYFPLNVAVGNIAGLDILFGVSMQIMWIVILFIVSQIVWPIGMKRYIAARG